MVNVSGQDTPGAARGTGATSLRGSSHGRCNGSFTSHAIGAEGPDRLGPDIAVCGQARPPATSEFGRFHVFLALGPVLVMAAMTLLVAVLTVAVAPSLPRSLAAGP